MTRLNAMTDAQQKQRKIVDGIQRREAADEILARIVADLRLLNKTWATIDVDNRNSMVGSWRAKIISALEAYF